MLIYSFCLFIFVESHYTGTVKIICYLILISMGVLIEKYLSTRLPWGVDVALLLSLAGPAARYPDLPLPPGWQVGQKRSS